MQVFELFFFPYQRLQYLSPEYPAAEITSACFPLIISYKISLFVLGRWGRGGAGEVVDVFIPGCCAGRDVCVQQVTSSLISAHYRCLPCPSVDSCDISPVDLGVEGRRPSHGAAVVSLYISGGGDTPNSSHSGAGGGVHHQETLSPILFARGR